MNNFVDLGTAPRRWDVHRGLCLRRKRTLKASFRDADGRVDWSLGERISLGRNVCNFLGSEPVDWLRFQREIVCCELRETRDRRKQAAKQ